MTIGPETYLKEIGAAKQAVSIPIIASLNCSSLGGWIQYAKEIEQAGANGLVLFNRFYQPDIDLETLCVTPNILLSTPMAMRLSLLWITILRRQLDVDLAATGGIHEAKDVIKMVMAGADVAMLCSMLLRRGWFFDCAPSKAKI